ncbi:MAG: Mrp/NBP35 family ATP-binding protein [Clostridia bacterium]|nr:Mrp/NBP35 family ATP-binding protein [Clostridia bacterium]MDE7328181.1 Mrp/NBP35 family ATP-binding protein [Clostridia bacterium]
MSDCTSDCSSCGKDCKERKASQKSKLNEHSKVKKVYAVTSAKGGVGKSMVTAQLAVLSRRYGKSVAVLDGDVTGASMTKYFGIKEKALGSERGILPAESVSGIKIVSMNMFLQEEDSPVVWRSSLATGALLQFWTDVCWGDIDAMFIDMPPGTGDIPLTVFQNLPVDGIIIVTTPQELVGMIASKGVKMAKMMNIPVIALVENMSYYKCDGCGEILNIFGESKAEKVAEQFGIDSVARLPISPALCAACDSGAIEYFDGDWLEDIVKKL